MIVLKRLKEQKNRLVVFSDEDQQYDTHWIKMQAGTPLHATDGTPILSGARRIKTNDKKFKDILLSIRLRPWRNRSVTLINLLRVGKWDRAGR